MRIEWLRQSQMRARLAFRMCFDISGVCARSGTRALRPACISFVWYAGSTWNAPFLMRSHGMNSGQAGTWLAVFAAIGAIGTFAGGMLADRLSVLKGDRRWYMWVPGYATLIMVPFQFFSYLGSELSFVISSFCVMTILASFFLGRRSRWHNPSPHCACARSPPR